MLYRASRDTAPLTAYEILGGVRYWHSVCGTEHAAREHYPATLSCYATTLRRTAHQGYDCP
eukprot:1515370-Rhodomonas_salina.1